jgi:hypothetical protein
VKSADETPYDPGEVFLLSPENQKKQITKNPNYRVVDTNSEEDPYGIVRRAANYHKEIHGEVPVYDYIADSDTTIKRSNLMPVGTLPMGDYTPELPQKAAIKSCLFVRNMDQHQRHMATLIQIHLNGLQVDNTVF